MIPAIDLFHEKVYTSQEGFVAIRDYTCQCPSIDVFTPNGEWFGNTGASNHLTALADIKHIIAWRIKWERNILTSKPNTAIMRIIGCNNARNRKQ